MRARVFDPVLGLGASLLIFVPSCLLTDELHGPVTALLRQLSVVRAVTLLAVLSVLVAAQQLWQRELRLPVAIRLSPRATAIGVGVIVGASAGLWRVLGSAATLPRILGDELLYADLGKSLANGDGLVLRGVSEHGYGIGYPAFLAPFYAFAGNGVTAYEAIQCAQIFVMASAAVPAFLLARRVLRREGALLTAALAVAVPQLLFTTLVMTEALFYPASLWVGLLAVRALERPTVARQVAVWTLLALAVSIRLQAVILGAALLTAVAIRPVASRRSELQRWLPTFVLFALAGLGALVVAQTTDVRPLGAYTTLVRSPDLGGTVIWIARSIGGLTIAVGFVTMAVLAPALTRLFRAKEGESAFAAWTVATFAWTVVTVGHFSSTPWGFDHVHERNLFPLVPLLIIAATAWAYGGLSRGPMVSTLGALGMIACVASLRQGDLVARFDVDTLSLLPWRTLDTGTFPASRLVILAALVGAGVALSTLRPWVLPLTAALAMLTALPVPVTAVPRNATHALSWVDDAVGKDADVLVVTMNIPDERCNWRPLEELALWTEFFNLSAGRATHVFQDNRSANLASTELTIAPDGLLLEQRRAPEEQLIVIDQRVTLAGTPIARLPGNVLGDHPGARTGLTLWRVGGSPRVVNHTAVAALAKRPACPATAA